MSILDEFVTSEKSRAQQEFDEALRLLHWEIARYHFDVAMGTNPDKSTLRPYQKNVQSKKEHLERIEAAANSVDRGRFSQDLLALTENIIGKR